MCVGSIKMSALKYFAEECVDSIQLGSIETFLIKISAWRISIIENRFLNFHVWFFNEKCPNAPKRTKVPSWMFEELRLHFWPIIMQAIN